MFRCNRAASTVSAGLRESVRLEPLRPISFASTITRRQATYSSIRWNSSSRTGRNVGAELQKAGQQYQSRVHNERNQKAASGMLYGAGCLIVMIGLTYASVPLYRMFCGATGFGGIPQTDPSKFLPDRLYPDKDADLSDRITVRFEADASEDLKWKFTPQQKFVKVLPGETALAFYTAKNWGTEDVVGIATYNITPSRISPYFAKVECFCFEQQKIRAGEEVDLPIFFFIDKDVKDDPNTAHIDDLVLSYTFFKTRRNNQGHLEPDAPLAEVERSLGFENYELAADQKV